MFAIVDFNGMNKLKRIYPEEAVSIFIEVTLDEMIERMNKRGYKKEDEWDMEL